MCSYDGQRPSSLPHYLCEFTERVDGKVFDPVRCNCEGGCSRVVDVTYRVDEHATLEMRAKKEIST